MKITRNALQGLFSLSSLKSTTFTFCRLLLVAGTMLVTNAAFSQNQSQTEMKAPILLKIGQQRGMIGLSSHPSSVFSLALKIETPDPNADQKPTGVEMEFEMVRSTTTKTSASSESAFGQHEEIYISGLGYSVGLCYVPLSSATNTIRMCPFIGLSMETIADSNNRIGFVASNIGARITWKPKFLNPNLYVVPEYKVTTGNIKLAGRQTTYQSQYALLGIGISFSQP